MLIRMPVRPATPDMCATQRRAPEPGFSTGREYDSPASVIANSDRQAQTWGCGGRQTRGHAPRLLNVAANQPRDDADNSRPEVAVALACGCVD